MGRNNSKSYFKKANMVMVWLVGGEKYVNTRHTKVNSRLIFNKSVKVITEFISRQVIYLLETGCLGSTSIFKCQGTYLGNGTLAFFHQLNLPYPKICILK